MILILIKDITSMQRLYTYNFKLRDNYLKADGCDHDDTMDENCKKIVFM